ncbi:PREDICTED: uncharacterized protein C45G9.7 isoform X2 [Ceratosolen solmsi marchali]|uniref:Uncharacterized protein C45G9.7 isoform X2 n=1 Tax=Ceratosolen solmsi marchali TaxID=326594 RepID=A0AAJ7DUK5_9HYME|nr:PREDICTED: uncharacterized protein C45G9.7 isoform X2 [Ceratosolen solmsi marchali]
MLQRTSEEAYYTPCISLRCVILKFVNYVSVVRVSSDSGYLTYLYIYLHWPQLPQIPITLHKETEINTNGEEVMKCGFKIGGGIDQDYKKSPQGYTDNGIYVTEVHEGSPAAKSGLRMHDKILQCNGYDFTMVTHKKAVGYIRKHPVLNLLVARKGVTST